MIFQIDDSTYYLQRDHQDISHGRLLFDIERSTNGSFRLRERRHPVELETGEAFAEITLEDGLKFSVAGVPCRCFHEGGKSIVSKETSPLPRGTTLEEDRTLIEELKKLRRR